MAVESEVLIGCYQTTYKRFRENEEAMVALPTAVGYTTNDIQSRVENLGPDHNFFRARVITLLVLVLAVAGLARAEDDHSADANEVAVWAGLYEQDRPREAFELGFDVTLKRDLFWGIKQSFGILVTDDDAYFGFVGFRYSLPLKSRRFRVDFSTATGLYQGGDGKDLGGVVEFRSGIDLMLRMPDGGYLSFGLYHISNAIIYDKNPGANTLLIRYVFGGR